MNWATFSKMPVRRRMETGVYSFDFLDLDAREYRLEVNGLKHGGAAATDILLQFSQDGVTFDENAANYLCGGQAAALKGVCLSQALPLDTWTATAIEIDGFNLAVKSWAHPNGGRFGVNSGARFAATYNNQSVIWTAMRVTTTANTPAGAVTHPFTHNLGILLREKRPS